LSNFIPEDLLDASSTVADIEMRVKNEYAVDESDDEIEYRSTLLK